MKRYCVVCFLCGFVVALAFARSVWVAKIDNTTEITLKEFNDAYYATILLSTMSTPAPVSKEQMDQVLSNKAQRKQFLAQYIDQTLLIAKAKEKKLYDENEINEQVQNMMQVVKRQVIMKQFADKFIFPKISVTSNEVDSVYAEEKKNKNSFVHKIPHAHVKEYIANDIKGQRLLQKLKEYTERLRLESQIIQNEQAL